VNKKLFFFHLLLASNLFLISSHLKAQNLVPNGGFEEGNCVGYPGNLVECNDWFSSLTPFEETTPEWFHSCIDDDNFSTPDVAFGFQEPYEGLGYGGLIGLITNAPASYREIIGVNLIEPLEVGSSYEVKFRFSTLTNAPETTILINNLGFNFSTHPYYSNAAFPTNSSHFAIDTVIHLTEEWLEVYEVFVADSSYQYLHIGNFFDDNLTSSIFPTESAFISYFVIDDVSVNELKVNTVSSSEKAGIKIYPNPCQDYIKLRIRINFNSCFF
jgi:hypothetical protein